MQALNTVITTVYFPEDMFPASMSFCPLLPLFAAAPLFVDSCGATFA